MATPVFDPALPVDDSLIVSAELRNQFNSLNDLCTDLAANVESRPFKPSGVAPLATSISDPPTQAEVEEIRDKINELLAALNA